MRTALVSGSENLSLRIGICRVKGKIANRLTVGFMTCHDIDPEFGIDVAGNSNRLSILNENGNSRIDRQRSHILYYLISEIEVELGPSDELEVTSRTVKHPFIGLQHLASDCRSIASDSTLTGNLHSILLIESVTGIDIDL